MITPHFNRCVHAATLNQVVASYLNCLVVFHIGFRAIRTELDNDQAVHNMSMPVSLRSMFVINNCFTKFPHIVMSILTR